MNLSEAEEYFYLKEGHLFWKKRKGRKGLVGNKAGCINSLGYTIVRFNKTNEYAHRIIWLLTNGYLPENCIDHIDGNRSNNNISNLREVSQQCNLRNVRNHITNTSGIKGVGIVRSVRNKSRYIAQIGLHNRGRSLYYGDSFEEAVLHRFAAEQCLDWNDCDSSSPAYVASKKILEAK